MHSWNSDPGILISNLVLFHYPSPIKALVITFPLLRLMIIMMMMILIIIIRENTINWSPAIGWAFHIIQPLKLFCELDIIIAISQKKQSWLTEVELLVRGYWGSVETYPHVKQIQHWLCHPLTVWLWACYLIPLSFSFSTYRREIKIITTDLKKKSTNSLTFIQPRGRGWGLYPFPLHLSRP